MGHAVIHESIYYRELKYQEKQFLCRLTCSFCSFSSIFFSVCGFLFPLFKCCPSHFSKEFLKLTHHVVCMYISVHLFIYFPVMYQIFISILTLFMRETFSADSFLIYCDFLLNSWVCTALKPHTFFFCCLVVCGVLFCFVVCVCLCVVDFFFF